MVAKKPNKSKAKAVRKVKARAKVKAAKRPVKRPKAAPKKKMVAKSKPKTRSKPKVKVPSKTVVTPALERALAAAQLHGVMTRLPPPIQPMLTVLRRVMLEAAPEVIEYIEKDSPSYDANGIFARLEPGMREVAVRFLNGSALASAALAGEADGADRVVRISAIEHIDLDLLQRLVREAVALNLSLGGA